MIGTLFEAESAIAEVRAIGVHLGGIDHVAADATAPTICSLVKRHFAIATTYRLVHRCFLPLVLLNCTTIHTHLLSFVGSLQSNSVLA